jgi:RNA polymerase sigma-70 factor (ECF subfamily)
MKTQTLITTLACIASLHFTLNTALAQDIDNFAPVVIKTVPEAGSKDVVPGEFDVKITFSKPMADQSWSWATAWENSGPQALDKIHYEADHKTCVMKVKLEPGKTYGWWINSGKFHGFQDTQGHPAVPYLFTFKVKDQ